MTTIYSPYFIVFNFNQNIDYKVDAGFTYNYASATDRAYRQKTRVPGADVLTVWIVRSVNDGDTNGVSSVESCFFHERSQNGRPNARTK